MKIHSNKKHKAFVSIFAIFFSAIVVSVLTALYVLLLKQIELMSVDASSYQALFVADSAFECALYKEQVNSGKQSMFLQDGNTFDYCLSSGDASLSSITRTQATGRDTSTLKVKMDTTGGSFCGTDNIDKNYKDTSGFTLPPSPDQMVITGQSKSCTDTSTNKIIEREIDFYY